MYPLKDTIPARSFPIVNWLIIAANVLVFVLVELLPRSRQLNQLVLPFGDNVEDRMGRLGTSSSTWFEV